MLYAICAMLIWSTTALQIRFINLDTLSIFFWTNIITLITAAIFINKNYKKLFRNFYEYKFVLLIVGIFATVNGITYLESIKLTTIANALITHYMAPVIVAVLSPIILKEKFNLKSLISLILSFIGLFLIINTKNISFDSKNFEGIIYGLISAIVYAIVMIIGRKYKNKIQQNVFIVSQSLVCVIFLVFLVDLKIPVLDTRSFILIFVFGIFNIFVAAYLFYKSLTKIEASKVAILGYIEPVGAIILATIFLKEIPTIKTIIGGILILSAPLILMTDKK